MRFFIQYSGIVRWIITRTLLAQIDFLFIDSRIDVGIHDTVVVLLKTETILKRKNAP